MATLPPAGAAFTLRRSARIKNAEVAHPPTTTANNGVTKSKPKSKPVRYDCTTCTRTLAASSFPKYLATDNCKHLINTCKVCLKAWLSSQLENTTYDKITCPECPEVMHNSDMQIHAIKKDYERYDELERKGIAEKIPGWRWCLNPKCRAGQVHEVSVESEDEKPLSQLRSRGRKERATKKAKAKDDSICVCNDCGAQACVPCDRPYHSGETCAAFQKRMKDDEDATLKVIEAQCKQCPNCNKNIEKAGGCDHMRCTQCNTQFCWHCRVTYNVINTPGGTHGAGCVYALPGRFDPHAANFQHQIAGAGGGVGAAQAAINQVFANVHALAPHGWNPFGGGN